MPQILQIVQPVFTRDGTRMVEMISFPVRTQGTRSFLIDQLILTIKPWRLRRDSAQRPCERNPLCAWIGQEHRGLIDLKGLGDPLHDAARQRRQAYFRTQCTRKLQERRAVFKLILVKQTVEPCLHGIPERRKKKRDYQNRKADGHEIRLGSRPLQAHGPAQAQKADTGSTGANSQ